MRFSLPLVFFVGFELCYYLLIAQTGIVEVFHSNLMLIGLLPIGGIIGSYFGASLKYKEKYKVYFLLCLQTGLTLFYPKFNPFTLFILGIAVGAMAPLIISSLKKAQNLDFILSLSIAYAAGTFLFSSNPFDRGSLGIILSVGALVSYLFIKEQNIVSKDDLKKEYISYSLLLMTFWIFLDSALFETLSRDISIPIWRGGYTFEIMLFHVIGVMVGVVFKLDSFQKSLTILILFALSYLFYFLREPLLLSIVYPFVISFYNVAILQSLVKIKSLRTIGIFMIFTGWIASGAGLFIALEQLIIYIPLLFLVVLLFMINQSYTLTKEAYNG
jgi:beta-carotene 15,15'-dioxygenase